MAPVLRLSPTLGTAYPFSPGALSTPRRCNKNYSCGQGMVTRCSNAGDQLRRPSAPPAAPSTLPMPPSPAPPSPAPEPAPAPDFSASPSPPPPPSASSSGGVTIEYQRQRAKEMQQYFLDKKFEEETSQSRIFGWTRKNEIANGRWVMFGLAVGLLTEYATGSNFVDQLRIIVSNLGILDVD